MRICLLEGDMSRTGGTERMTAWLAGALAQRHEMHIISLRLSGGKVFFPLVPAVIHHVLEPAPGKLGISKQIRQIKRYLKAHRIDRVINVDMGMGFYGILAAKGTGAKTVTWEHGNFYNDWGSRLFPKLRRYASKKSDILVVLTEKDNKHYAHTKKKCAPRRVNPNPAASHRYGYDKSSQIILSVGHLLPNKGYHRAVEIGKRILPSRPGWKWVICGEGPEREKLENAIREAGLEGRIELPGLVTDMDERYRSAAMLVLTSDMEGLPMTLLEGKSWGLPLVAFDIMTGPSDIISDGINGCLIPPFDLEAMAEKLAALMDDAALRQQFSTAAHVGMDKFSTESVVKKWETLLRIL